MLPAIAAGASIAGSLLGSRSKRKAAKQAKRMAAAQRKMAEESKRITKANIAALRTETAEGVRRAIKNRDQMVGLAAARAAASGVEVSGSTKLYLDEFKQSLDDDIKWMRKSATSKEDLMELQDSYNRMGILLGAQQTQLQSNALRAEATSSLFSGLKSFADYGTNEGWFS